MPLFIVISQLFIQMCIRLFRKLLNTHSAHDCINYSSDTKVQFHLRLVGSTKVLLNKVITLGVKSYENDKSAFYV